MRVVGVPRRSVTLVAAGSFASLTRGGSGISMRTVACSLDPGGAGDAVVQTVAHEQRIAGICRQPLLGVLGRERARLDAVARQAGPPVTLERLLVEETPALLETPRQTCQLGRPVKLFGIAVKGDVVRRPRCGRLRVDLQDQLAHEDR